MSLIIEVSLFLFLLFFLFGFSVIVLLKVMGVTNFEVCKGLGLLGLFVCLFEGIFYLKQRKSLILWLNSKEKKRKIYGLERIKGKRV